MEAPSIPIATRYQGAVLLATKNDSFESFFLDVIHAITNNIEK
jgi:hypothetical protein